MILTRLWLLLDLRTDKIGDRTRRALAVASSFKMRKNPLGFHHRTGSLILRIGQARGRAIFMMIALITKAMCL